MKFKENIMLPEKRININFNITDYNNKFVILSQINRLFHHFLHEKC